MRDRRFRGYILSRALQIRIIEKKEAFEETHHKPQTSDPLHIPPCILNRRSDQVASKTCFCIENSLFPQPARNFLSQTSNKVTMLRDKRSRDGILWQGRRRRATGCHKFTNCPVQTGKVNSSITIGVRACYSARKVL